MRQKNREITDPMEIIEVMRGCDVCRLGLNDEDGFPYVIPLNFGMGVTDGKIRLYFHGAMKGHKPDLIRRDDREAPFDPAALPRTCVFALDVEQITGKRKEAKKFD